MNKHSPKHYYRIASLPLIATPNTEKCMVKLSDGLAQKIRPGDGVVVGPWDDYSKVGKVSQLGIVLSTDLTMSTIELLTVTANITFKPNPAGRRWWKNEYFKFAESVRERYMLDDLFAEHFPQYSDIDLGQVTGTQTNSERQYQKIGGYIYVLHSKYGYKIGKTVNMKSRTRLFEVKLPFKFDIAVSEYVTNYSKAEADLHRQYAAKRLEGEWFDLHDVDVRAIQESLRGLKT